MTEVTNPILHIACGSYDGTVFAMSYEHQIVPESAPTKLKPVFIDPDAHGDPVTSVAVCGDTVLSGSGDEAIQLFSLSRHCRMGSLELHTGSVRHLLFVDSRHFLSAGEDSCLAVWRRHGKSWQCVRQMRRHKAPVVTVTLHPSSRIAFSIADSEGDHTLRIWNLCRGRQAYTTRLKGLNIEGATSLTSYVYAPLNHHLLLALVSPRPARTFHRLDILDLAEARQKAIFSIRFPTTLSVAPVVYRSEEAVLFILAPIGSMLKVHKCDLKSGEMEVVAESRVPGKRFKFLKVLDLPGEGENALKRLVVLATTDSDGSYLRGYAMDLEASLASKSLSLKPLFTYDVEEIRLTEADAVWTSGMGAEDNAMELQVVGEEMEIDDDESEEEIEDIEEESDEGDA